MEQRTITIFRRFRDGDIIALFPEIPRDIYGYFWVLRMFIDSLSNCESVIDADDLCDLAVPLGIDY